MTVCGYVCDFVRISVCVSPLPFFTLPACVYECVCVYVRVCMVPLPLALSLRVCGRVCVPWYVCL